MAQQTIKDRILDYANYNKNLRPGGIVKKGLITCTGESNKPMFIEISFNNNLLSLDAYDLDCDIPEKSNEAYNALRDCILTNTDKFSLIDNRTNELRPVASLKANYVKCDQPIADFYKNYAVIQKIDIKNNDVAVMLRRIFEDICVINGINIVYANRVNTGESFNNILMRKLFGQREYLDFLYDNGYNVNDGSPNKVVDRRKYIVRSILANLNNNDQNLLQVFDTVRTPEQLLGDRGMVD